MTSSYRIPHITLQRLPSVLPPSIDLEDLISYPDPQARQGLTTRHLLQAPLTGPSCCHAHHPRSSRRSSYPLSTNLSHQLKINMDSDPDIRPHLPSSSLARISRQATTSLQGVGGHWLDSFLRYSVSWHTDIQDGRIVLAARPHSLDVMLHNIETSSNELQRNHPHQRPSRIQVVTFTVLLLHS